MPVLGRYTMPVLDRYEPDSATEDDCMEGRSLPFISRCTGANDLDPQPPAGWWAILRYDSYTQPVSPAEVAAWLLCVKEAQSWSKQVGEPRHMIAREPDGDRVLVVHPDLYLEAHAMIECLNTHLDEDIGAGAEWFREQHLLHAAGRTFLLRLWSELTVGHIVSDLGDCGHDTLLIMRLDDLDGLQPSSIFELAELAAGTRY